MIVYGVETIPLKLLLPYITVSIVRQQIATKCKWVNVKQCLKQTSISIDLYLLIVLGCICCLRILNCGIPACCDMQVFHGCLLDEQVDTQI